MTFKKLYRRTLLATAMTIAISLPLANPAMAQQQNAAPQVQINTTPEPATVTAWGNQSPDVTADPSILYGVLPNGMKYAIQKNQTPQGSASLRLHIAVGSIAEADDERGVSHFVEHMAFNGSKNVPEGEMIRILERQGLAFGPDTNASTDFDATVYELDLPKSEKEALDTGLFLLRETAGNLTFAPDAVDRERGVLLSEVQTRNSAQRNRIFDLLRATFPETPFGKRDMTGTAEILNNISAAKIKDFYHRYYRPENATLVAVGDFDVAQMEADIKAKFSDWKGVGPAGAAMDRGKVDGARPFTVSNFADPAIQPFVTLDFAKPLTDKTDSIARRTDKHLINIASQIMAQRFQKIALQPGAKIVGGGINVGPFYQVADNSTLYMLGAGDDWQSALATGEQELRRLLLFGVTQSEVDEQLANIETNIRNAAAQAGTRKSNSLVGPILASIYDRDIVTTPQTRLEIFEQAKPKLTVDAVNAAIRSKFGGAPNSLHISSKTPIEDPAAAAIAIISESAKIAVTPPAEAQVVTFAYDDFGASGKIAEDKRISDLGIRTIRFDNNVRLNLKKTDFKAGEVRYSLRFGGGFLALENVNPALGLFMQLSSGVSGLGKHDIEQIQQIAAGKAVNIGFSLDEDSYKAAGATTATDLELQMKLLAAYLSDPGYRAEADTLYKNQTAQIIASVSAQPMLLGTVTTPYFLTGKDPRFGIGSLDEIATVGLSDMKAALEAAKGSPIEIALVGDFDEQAAINIVAKTFGALPKRAAKSPAYAKAREMAFAPRTDAVTIYHQGAADQGVLFAYWPTTDGSDYKSQVTREIMAEIFGSALRDEIREKLGATYSPDTESTASAIFKGYGHISSKIVVDPAKIEAVEQAIGRVSEAMRASPPDADSMLRARKPLLERIEKNQRENGAWMDITDEAQSRPDDLKRWKGAKALYESITPAEIQAAAQKYLIDSNQHIYRVIVDPAKAAPGEAPSS